MDYQTLGKTGLEVSRMALGAMNFSTLSQEKVNVILDKAHDLGINFVDTANAYGDSEEKLGKWFQKNKTRDDWIISTKVGWPVGDGVLDKGLSNKHITLQLEQSLQRLQTDYIDIYQPHYLNGDSDVARLAQLFSSFVSEGTVRHIGSPVFTQPWLVVEWLYEARIAGLQNLSFQQFPFSLNSRSIEKNGLKEVCERFALPVMTFAAMSGGLLTGKYKADGSFPADGKPILRKIYEEGKAKGMLEGMERFCQEHDEEMAAVASAWVLSHDFVTAIIIGASKPEQLESTASNLSVQLDPEQVKTLTELSNRHHIW